MRRAAVVWVFVGCGTLSVLLRPTGASVPAGDLWAWVQADPERALLEVVNGGAWLLAGWLFLVTGLSLLATARGCTGRLAGRLARLVTPIAIRRILEASLGVALAIGPAGAAVAGPGPTSSTVGTLSALTPVPAPNVAPALPVPNLDRPGDVVAKPAVPPRSTASPAPAAPPSSPADPTPPPTSARTHTVLAGDTLWAIAAAELAPTATPAEITLAWQRWYQENRTVIGSDPALIIPGQLLVDQQPRR